MMIGGHYLPRAVGPLRSGATAENRKVGIAIGGVTTAGCFHVAKDLIVRAIFLDYVNDVLDRTLSDKKFGRGKIHQPVILHGLLRVARQRGVVGQRNDADVSRNNRPAVLAALAVFLFVGRKRGVWRIRRAPAVVHAHRGWFETCTFSVSDEEFAVCDRDCGWILSRGNESQNFRFRSVRYFF